MESGDRSAFLERLRRRLAGEAHASTLRPIPAWGGEVPAIAYRADFADPVACFTRALEAVGGKVRVLRGEDDLRALLEDVCRDYGVRRAVLTRDPECAGVAEIVRGLGIAAEDLASSERAAEADLGITGAAFGVALTGSVVVDSERAGGRTASLLPPVHLALLRADRIVATPGAVLRTLPKRPAGLPSNLVFITGPSRSADIELQLTLGVHGPREVWVGLMGAPIMSR